MEYTKMKNIYKKFTNILTVVLCAAPLLLMAGDAEEKAANELLDVTKFEKLMDDSINASVDMIKKMDPRMESHESTLREFYKKHMSAATLRKDVVNMYVEIFTAKEINDMIAFYKTETGQKMLFKSPEIIQRSMQLAQTRVMENMGELQKMLEANNEASAK
jgi:hypothetical protein